jgi:hypothetical protein
MFIVLSLAERMRTRAAWLTTTIAGTATVIVMQYTIVLPLMHYHQTDGFFTFLFGFIPLMMIWLADALIRARFLRWIALTGGVLLYRYTYGLNLAELLLSVGVLFFADAIRRGGPIWVRLAIASAIVPLSMAASQVLDQFPSLLSQYGWIVGYDVPLVMKGELAAGGALVAMAILSAIVGRAGLIVRAIRFPIAFVIISVELLTHIQQKWPDHQPYYICKYPVYAVVLAAGAFVVVVAALLGLLVDGASWKSRAAMFLGGIPVGGAVVYAFLFLRTGFAPYWPFFIERISGKPPYSLTRPLADLGAWQRIERVLDAPKKKHFGGYISWDWTMFDFMNAAFGYYNGGRSFWEGGGARMTKDYCVFWDRARAGPWSSVDNLPGPLRDEWGRLESMPQRECVSYRATWDHATIRTLCHACW